MSEDHPDPFGGVTTALHSLVPEGSGAPTLVRATVLRQIRGPGAPADHALAGRDVVIGRSSKAHISIDSPELSRQHAELVRDAGEYQLRDLESRNGVFLNGVRIHRALLRDGDTVQVGNVVFLFLEGY